MTASTIAGRPEDVEGFLVGDLHVRVLDPDAVTVNVQDPVEPRALVERLVVGRQRPFKHATGKDGSDEDPDGGRGSVTMTTHASQGSSMTEPAAGDAAETLRLADWRRRVADLYAEVRRLAPTDHAAALELWRSTRERLFREHPQSPVPAAKRNDFTARHFPIDPEMRFEVTVDTDAPAERPAGALIAATPLNFGTEDDAAARSGGLALATPIATDLPVSAGGTMAMRRLGHVEIPFLEGARRLGVFWMSGYAGGLFIPFRDATNGSETYGAGRYLLDAAKSADLGGDSARGSLILDFNFAFHPSCAFDPKWACPLAPPENRLDLPIRAGERLA